MNVPKIYADFNGNTKTDSGEDWLFLDGKGTTTDLKRLGIELKDGLKLILYDNDEDSNGNSDDLEVDGVVKYDPDYKWVAIVDWSKMRHASDRKEGK
jgi:hypothetical protein